MQFNFFKNLCTNLLENEYRPVYGSFESAAITEASKYIAFSRIIGSTLYTIFIIRTTLVSDYKTITENYSSRLSGDFTLNVCDEWGKAFPLSFSGKILLTLLICDNPDETLSEFSKITDIIGNEEFIEIRWIINPLKKEIVVNGNQPKKLNGIEKIIKASFTDSTDNTATTLSKEYSSVLKKKQLQLKSISSYGTYSLIAVLILIYICELIIMLTTGSDTTNIIEEKGILYPVIVLENGEYYRLFTSIFLHAGISHIAANCLSLYIFGTRVERYFGNGFFMAVFIFSGLISSVATVFLINPYSGSLGASGAIFGLEGAVLAYILMKKRSVDGFDLNLILIFSIIGIGFGFLQPGINNIAHISGFLSGLAVSLIYLALSKK